MVRVLVKRPGPGLVERTISGSKSPLHSSSLLPSVRRLWRGQTQTCTRSRTQGSQPGLWNKSAQNFKTSDHPYVKEGDIGDSGNTLSDSTKKSFQLLVCFKSTWTWLRRWGWWSCPFRPWGGKAANYENPREFKTKRWKCEIITLTCPERMCGVWREPTNPAEPKLRRAKSSVWKWPRIQMIYFDKKWDYDTTQI